MNKILAAFIFVVWLYIVPSQAATLDPFAFVSLGTLNATAPVSVNTDRLQMTGGASYMGVIDAGSGDAVFTFDDITVGDVSIFGTRTLGLLTRSNMHLAGNMTVARPGGLELVAPGVISAGNVTSSGTHIGISGNQINLEGTLNSGTGPTILNSGSAVLNLTTNTSTGTRGGILSALSQFNLTTGSGINGPQSGMVNLRSAQSILGTNTISGQLSVADTGGLVGSPGVESIAPIPLPDAFLLFAGGLAVVRTLMRRTVG